MIWEQEYIIRIPYMMPASLVESGNRKVLVPTAFTGDMGISLFKPGIRRNPLNESEPTDRRKPLLISKLTEYSERGCLAQSDKSQRDQGSNPNLYLRIPTPTPDRTNPSNEKESLSQSNLIARSEPHCERSPLPRSEPRK